MGQGIQSGCPKALSMPSSHCLSNQGMQSCEPYWGKKGCCFQQDHAPSKRGLTCPSSGLVVAGSSPGTAQHCSSAMFPLLVLDEPQAPLEFAGQEQASLGPRCPRMEQIQICTETTGPSIQSHCLGFNLVALPPPRPLSARARIPCAALISCLAGCSLALACVCHHFISVSSTASLEPI